MAKLKITRATGEVSEHQITPGIEYAFELYKGKGFHKAFAEESKQSDVFWLAWECLKRAAVTVPLFGAEFVEMLAKVEVLDDDPEAQGVTRLLTWSQGSVQKRVSRLMIYLNQTAGCLRLYYKR